jgi:hypothetical protein
MFALDGNANKVETDLLFLPTIKEETGSFQTEQA